MPSAPKVQRWVDIIAALLARRSHATFEELARDVPAYLADGSVKTITQDGVVFSQDVHDPLSLVKQREVPKRVRATDGRG